MLSGDIPKPYDPELQARIFDARGVCRYGRIAIPQ
jgi:hypothetical protein